MSEPGRTPWAGPSPARISLGGLCFALHTSGLSLLPETDQSYRQFILDPTAADTGETIDVCVTVAEVRPRGGTLLFDSGTWRVFARQDERSVVFHPPALPAPLCEARFRPGAAQIELVCAPCHLESRAGIIGIRSPFRYPLDQVLTMYGLGGTGLILHAAGIVRRGSAIVFPGVSGAGKSTLTRLAAGWAGALPLSDDRVILRLQGTGAAAHGTPWPGEAGVAERHAAPAGWLLFLEKGGHNGVRTITSREALARLLPTASLPWFDAKQLEGLLRACDRIIRGVPAGVFTFRDEARALESLAAFLSDS